MKPPCELIVTRVLPTIRAAIVKTLIEDYKMKQLEISKLLGISQSAVSQYYTSARAVDKNLIKTFPEIEKYAKEVAKKVVNGKMKSNQIILCEPCMNIRKKKKFDNVLEEFLELRKCKICNMDDKD
jgi:predicted transcriptional regulator